MHRPPKQTPKQLAAPTYPLVLPNFPRPGTVIHTCEVGGSNPSATTSLEAGPPPRRSRLKAGRFSRGLFRSRAECPEAAPAGSRRGLQGESCAVAQAVPSRTSTRDEPQTASQVPTESMYTSKAPSFTAAHRSGALVHAATQRLITSLEWVVTIGSFSGVNAHVAM